MFSILELLIEVFVTLVPMEGGDGVDAQIGESAGPLDFGVLKIPGLQDFSDVRCPVIQLGTRVLVITKNRLQ